jgi:hypothetical protein
MSDHWWSRDITEAAALILGRAVVDRAVAEWHGFAETHEVRITFAGPYNTGKSSLIKRLLVDAGVAVPPWLTAGARRETFQVEVLPVGELTLVDTPGLESGEQTHDAAAAAAIALTDALVLLVSPQLVLSDVERVSALIDGTFLAEPGGALFPPKALILVIARGDAIGTDPVDDVDGYRALCQRKRDQLITALRRHVRDTSLPEIFVVAADAGGTLARKPQPMPEEYDATRPWDNIAPLWQHLAALPARRRDLRVAAAGRFWRHLAGQAIHEADGELQRLDHDIKQRQNLIDQLAALRNEVGMADEHALANLHRLVVGELSAVVQSAGEDPAGLEDEAIRRITQRVDAWLVQANRSLLELARRAEVELRDWVSTPAPERHLRDTITGLLSQRRTQDGAARPGEQRISQAIEVLGNNTEKMLGKVYELGTGITLETAKKELGQYEALLAQLKPETAQETLALLDKPGVFLSQELAPKIQAAAQKDPAAKQIIDFLRKPGGITSPAQAAKIAKTVRWTSAIFEAAPMMYSMARLALEDRRVRQLSQDRQRRKEALTAEISQRAKDIAQHMLAGPGAPWAEAVRAVQGSLQLAGPTPDEMAALQARYTDISGCRRLLAHAFERHQPLT